MLSRPALKCLFSETSLLTTRTPFSIQTGVRPFGTHGNSVILPEHKTKFLQTVNQPYIKSFTNMQPMTLYEMFVNTDKGEGRWGIKISVQAFYKFLERVNFTYIHPFLVPWVLDKHIAARELFAQEFVGKEPFEQDFEMLTTIFIDGTIFADKFETGFGVHKMKLVSDKDDPVEAFYAQFPVLARNLQLYQGINYFGATPAFFINDHRDDGKGSVTSDILEIFLRGPVATLANKIRRELNLPPTEPIRIVWDHAAVHKSQKTQRLLQELNLIDAQLPARCPELNVIENLWAIYKRLLMKEERTQKADTLKQAVHKLVQSMNQTTIRNLCASFLPRAEKMVEVHGQPFHYKGNPERTNAVVARV